MEDIADSIEILANSIKSCFTGNDFDRSGNMYTVFGVELSNIVTELGVISGSIDRHADTQNRIADALFLISDSISNLPREDA